MDRVQRESGPVMSRHNIDINALGEALADMPKPHPLADTTVSLLRQSIQAIRQTQQVGDVSRLVDALRECQTLVHAIDSRCGDDVPLAVHRELRLLDEALSDEITRVRCEEEQGYRDMSRIRQERRQAKKVASKKSRKKP